ncbi:MAG: hypothetical protein GY828_03630 [Candidatus Gracilibacteria bacterium]|nr:hypothetical protein [Candidatus Gracilibacteria bacterium]
MNKHRQYTLIFLLLFIFNISCTNEIRIVKEKDILFSFDTSSVGSTSMKIVSEELRNNNNISVIRERVYKRGTYAGAAMFSMCSSVIIAKKRGFSHFVILNSEINENCKECEWSQIITLGMLSDVDQSLVINLEDEKIINEHDVRTYITSSFPKIDLTKEAIEILDVNSFMPICKKMESICYVKKNS